MSKAKYDFELPDRFVDLDDAGGYLFHYDCLVCKSPACPFNHSVQEESDVPS